MSPRAADVLKDEVLHYLVHDKLVHYPLPWVIDVDWSCEVVTTTTPQRIVARFPNATIATAFIEIAADLAREAGEFEAEFEKMVRPCSSG